MQLATIIQQYLPLLRARYAKRLLPGHLNAIDAMLRCRTGAGGEMRLACRDCLEQQDYPLSCGHRSCPKCQNHETSRWLDRQQAKLLPVEYFLVTFTLPQELRSLAWRHQRQLYASNRPFQAVISRRCKIFILISYRDRFETRVGASS